MPIASRSSSSMPQLQKSSSAPHFHFLVPKNAKTAERHALQSTARGCGWAGTDVTSRLRCFVAASLQHTAHSTQHTAHGTQHRLHNTVDKCEWCIVLSQLTREIVDHFAVVIGPKLGSSCVCVCEVVGMFSHGFCAQGLWKISTPCRLQHWSVVFFRNPSKCVDQHILKKKKRKETSKTHAGYWACVLLILVVCLTHDWVGCGTVTCYARADLMITKM